MTDRDKQKKREIFLKIVDLVEVADALGQVSDDEQTIFLAQTLKLVLAAGSTPEDSRLFSEHCLNYINEKLMENNELEVEKHLVENVAININ
jgi:hypothetical protein